MYQDWVSSAVIVAKETWDDEVMPMIVVVAVIRLCGCRRDCNHHHILQSQICCSPADH